MPDFYRMDPGAWDFGTAQLSLEEEAAYLRIVNAIHKHKGPVPNSDRVLAGLFRVSTRKARALVAALVDAGKIVIEDGWISNERAISDLVQRGFVSASRAESGAKGGRTKAERASKALENNDTPIAIASPREEKRREEKSIEEPLCISPPKKRRNPETDLPEGWVPNEANTSHAQDKGLSMQEINDEAARFRDYHYSKQSRFRDWDAAWRTWISNAIKFGRSGGMAGKAAPGGYGQGSSIASIAARRRATGQV